MKRTFYLLVALLFLSACMSPATPISIVAVTPSLTATVTSVPTSTKSPTTPVTSTGTISVTSTDSFTPTNTPPTYNPLLTAQVSWNICESAEEPNYETDLSPDGNWLAVACDPNNSSKFNGSNIVKLGGDVIWEASFYEAYGIFQKNELPPEGIKEGKMNVVHWTNDGNYVYLRPSFCCADAPEYVFFNYFNNALALYRLDLRNGGLTATLQPFTNDVLAGYYVSFSPTDKYLVYVASNSPRDVHAYNLQTGEVLTITVDEQYIASGNLEWSQNGNMAIFVAAKSGWGSETQISNGISYFLLDLKKRSSIHLFDQPDMYRVSWTQGDDIILHNVSKDIGLLYNLQNKTLTEVTPTPVP